MDFYRKFSADIEGFLFFFIHNEIIKYKYLSRYNDHYNNFLIQNDKTIHSKSENILKETRQLLILELFFQANPSLFSNTVINISYC